MRAKQLRAERATLITDARALINKPNATAADGESADAMLARADALMTEIERLERADKLAAELAANTILAAATLGVSVDEHESVIARDKRIFLAHSIGAVHTLSAEDQTYRASRIITNAAAGDTGAANGAYTIAPGWANELLIALKAFGGVRQVARNIQTDTGVSLPWVLMDDTANVATIVGAENTQITADSDLQFSQVSLGGYTYKSGLMPVSLQLLQDSAFDFDSVLRDAMMMRFARGQNAHFTTGSGSGQPQGVLTGAVLGVTGATGTTTTISFDDLMNLEHSVDPAYRDGAIWMFHDTTLKAIRKLKDSQARPLFVPGYVSGTPDQLLGRSFNINQQMPVMAANAKSILFGNFMNYLIRDVLGIQMMVLRERFADSLQVAYLAFCRTDAKVISAAHPLAYYQNSAT